MFFHPAALLAFFADQATQAPVVVQCPQAAPESWVKWLLRLLFKLLSACFQSLLAFGSLFRRSGAIGKQNMSNGFAIRSSESGEN